MKTLQEIKTEVTGPDKLFSYSNNQVDEIARRYASVTMIPELKEFAEQMEIELKANEHKGNWREWKDIPEMICELDYHKGKLLAAIKEDDKVLVKEYLADCANILMFIGNAGNLYRTK